MGSYTELPFNLPGHVYTGSTPTFSLIQQSYEKNLKENKIKVVVFLCSVEESMAGPAKLDLVKWYQEKGLHVIHLPITDHAAPNLEALNRAVEDAYRKVLEGNSVLIHCKGGAGRTGTFSACLTKKILGKITETASQAIDWVLKYNEIAMPENKVQEELVERFCQSINQEKNEPAKHKPEVSQKDEFLSLLGANPASGKKTTYHFESEDDSSPTTSPELERKGSLTDLKKNPLEESCFKNIPTDFPSLLVKKNNEVVYFPQKGILETVKKVLRTTYKGLYPLIKRQFI